LALRRFCFNFEGSNMGGFFYQLGRLAGPKIRKVQWAWAAVTAPEAEAIAAERKAGADMANSVRQQRRVCADVPIANLLAATGGALAARVKNKQRTFEFVCLSGEQPEAFCLPGGFVFVSRPMIELCGQNADRLAFVLAHEMAHILEGHAMQRLVSSTILKTVSRAKVIPHAAAGAMGKLGTEFLEKAYSRQQELAADALGLRLTLAAGFDGQAAVAVFEKLAALEQPAGLAKYFSTHPEAQERITRLRQLLDQRSPKTLKPE
jgi:predicted Zn-dependent protease